MYQKICNVLSIVASVASISLVGAGTFGYFWITNEANQEKLKQQVVNQVTSSMKLPKMTGPALPTAKPSAGIGIPSFR